ncbi:MAG TPA: ubiquinone biosynthesis protein UbiA, partial [Rhodanobacteraceae bacterium]|nr:ubiquinone biosynthesis protein UbiA [Rhodanobacteraceae bacterium]
FLPVMSPLALGVSYQLATLAAGVLLLLLPAFRLLLSREGRDAARLFDRASLYPVVQLAIITAFVLVQ